MNDKFFDELKEKIKKYFISGGSHAFDHTERVYNLALKLSKGEKVDLDIIKAAVLLHDVARLREENKEIKCHAEEGAKIAREILEETEFPKEKLKKVCYAIEVHRHSKGITPKTREAEILQDADRLDALGAITIARMFSSGGELKRPIYAPHISLEKELEGSDFVSSIHGFHHKTLKIKPETFKTEKARKIAKGRYVFVQKFLKQFKAEWEGKK